MLNIRMFVYSILSFHLSTSDLVLYISELDQNPGNIYNKNMA